MRSMARAGTVVFVLAGVPLVWSTATHAQSSVIVLATGLDNPRGLAFGMDGALYVAEAGRGGNSALCLTGADGVACYGPTGAVTRITGIGVHQRVVTGLPSLAGTDGNRATGPHDIDFGFGTGWVTVGLANNPANRAPFAAAGISLGWLYRLDMSGGALPLLDLAAHEAVVNPDGGAIDSNPYGFRIVPTGAAFTDAGGNALMRIAPTGTISTLSVFPTRTVPHPFGGPPVNMQSVPTTVVPAPDGSYFVGELTGFPFPVGGARVYHVPTGGGAPQVVAAGFTNIIDIAVDFARGVGYVLEIDADGQLAPGTAGRLVRVAFTGQQTVIPVPGLVYPGGLAVGPDGALYVTNHSTAAGRGEVLRIVP